LVRWSSSAVLLFFKLGDLQPGVDYRRNSAVVPSRAERGPGSASSQWSQLTLLPNAHGLVVAAAAKTTILPVISWP